jgi:AcrR family transcriptional regulator
MNKSVNYSFNRLERKDRLKKIYEASLKIFAKYGYKKTAIEDIAHALGMTKGNLYLYAKGKRDLYEKTVGYGLEQWQNKVSDEITGEQDVVKQFTSMCTKAYEYLAEDVHLHQILINDPTIFTIFPAEDRFAEINRRSIALIKEILLKGIKEKTFHRVDVDRISELIFSIYVMFIIKTYVKSEGESPQKMFEEGLHLILKGLMSK